LIFQLQLIEHEQENKIRKLNKVTSVKKDFKKNKHDFKSIYKKELEALRELGVPEENIQKAGERQSDGSYYFFESDPMYIEAPEVLGYRFINFYFKGTNKMAFNPRMTDIDGGKYLPRWNMINKDVELEARYEKNSYRYYFNDTAEDETNPNANGTYCYLDDGVVNLQPATSTIPSKHFRSWTYSKYVDEVWATFDISTLPTDFYEDEMRIEADWTYDQFTVTFAFELYGKSGNTPLNYDEVCEGLSVLSNIATINGQKIVAGEQTAKGKNDTLKVQYNSWLDVFHTVNSQYYVSYCTINGEKRETLLDYFAFKIGDFTADTTIVFVLKAKD
ncbi:MAG: hypothetical protein MJ072_07140, partial [Clostridia bacterium]|nr:hypothetical protein [Clostridia bacterium]